MKAPITDPKPKLPPGEFVFEDFKTMVAKCARRMGAWKAQLVRRGAVHNFEISPRKLMAWCAGQFRARNAVVLGASVLVGLVLLKMGQRMLADHKGFDAALWNAVVTRLGNNS